MDNREEGYNISETGNWNVAADYSKIKIMKPLALCDEYGDIAYFGYTNFLDQLINFNIPKDSLRIEGFKRLIRELIKIIDNSIFAIKQTKKQTDEEKGDKIILLNHRKNLVAIEGLIPQFMKVIYSNVKHTQNMQLNEKEYLKCLEIVFQIKREINDPLNRNHLIFTDKEEFDPRAYKENLKHRMINQG